MNVAPTAMNVAAAVAAAAAAAVNVAAAAAVNVAADAAAVNVLLLLRMLLLLVNGAAAVHRHHIAMAAHVYDCCRSLLDIAVNAASGVYLHVGLQAVMLAEKRYLDRVVQAHLSRYLFSASMTACSPTCR